VSFISLDISLKLPWGGMVSSGFYRGVACLLF
jgi:hypothetical protein